MIIAITNKKVCRILSIIALLLTTALSAQAQRVALKTNALDYVALTPNLAVETRLSRTLSLQFGVACNPFNYKISDIRTTNFRVEPELRYWFNRPMARHFVALSMTAATYSLQFRNRIFSGDLVGAGFSYGYALVLSKHWNMEAEVGIGLASVKAYKYHKDEERPRQQNYDKITPIPIRLALSFSYIF